MTARSLWVLVLVIVAISGLLYGFLFDNPVILGVGALAMAAAAVLSWLTARARADR